MSYRRSPCLVVWSNWGWWSNLNFEKAILLLETKNWYSIDVITGELSESQKQEMEKHKEKLVQREREIEGLRLQMAKLSKIIDKQKDEIKSLQKQLRLV